MKNCSVDLSSKAHAILSRRLSGKCVSKSTRVPKSLSEICGPYGGLERSAPLVDVTSPPTKNQIKLDTSINDGNEGSLVRQRHTFSIRLPTRLGSLGARVIIVFIRVSRYTNYFYPLSVRSKYRRTLFFDAPVRN